MPGPGHTGPAVGKVSAVPAPEGQPRVRARARERGANSAPRRIQQANAWNGPQSASGHAALAVYVPDELLRAIAEQVAAALAPLVHQRQGEPYLDVGAAAQYLACGRQRIYDLVSAGRVEPMRDGRRLLFRPEDLDLYLQLATTDHPEQVLRADSGKSGDV